MVEVLLQIQPNSELLSVFDVENGWNVESFILKPPNNSQIWNRNLNPKKCLLENGKKNAEQNQYKYNSVISTEELSCDWKKYEQYFLFDFYS